MLYTIKLPFLTTMYLFSLGYKYCSGLLNADTATSLACVAGAKRGGGKGAAEREKGINPPPLFPFLPIPYPLPLSTPATQAATSPLHFAHSQTCEKMRLIVCLFEVYV